MANVMPSIRISSVSRPRRRGARSWRRPKRAWSRRTRVPGSAGVGGSSCHAVLSNSRTSTSRAGILSQHGAAWQCARGAALRCCNVRRCGPPRRNGPPRVVVVTRRARTASARGLKCLVPDRRRHDGAGQRKEPAHEQETDRPCRRPRRFRRAHRLRGRAVRVRRPLRAAVRQRGGLQIAADLTISPSRSAGRVDVAGRPPARHQSTPYVLLTAGLGSFGPLLYLIRRFGRDDGAAPHSVLREPRVTPARA